MRAVGVALILALASCARQAPPAAAPAVENEIAKTFERGPLRATLRLTPKEPSLIDPIKLDIEAEIEQGYALTLPQFGEGLGDFIVRDYHTDAPETSGGKTIHRAHYELEVFVSGEFKVRPMLFTFEEQPKEPGSASSPEAPTAEGPAAKGPPKAETNQEPATTDIKAEGGKAETNQEPATTSAKAEGGKAETPPSLPEDAGKAESGKEAAPPLAPENPASPEEKIYKLATEDLALTVKPLPEEASRGDLAPAAGPQELPAPPQTLIYYIAGGAVLALALGVALFFVLRSRLGRVFAPPPVPPHERAFRELRALLDEELIAKGRVKEFFFRLTFIIRTYIELRFGLHAPEQTTEEFLPNAASSGLLSPAHQKLLERFLGYADLVKYAKHAPGAKDIENSFNAARTFINETTPVPAQGGGNA